jgi:hypothetical protein
MFLRCASVSSAGSVTRLSSCALQEQGINIGVSVKLTSMETNTENAIVQPN